MARTKQAAPAMLQIQHLPTDSLIPADYNPRKIADDQMAALCRSIEQFGFVEPVVLNARSGLIVGGHQRVEAAKRLGMDTVPVVEVDLDDAKEKALNVALNKISGEFDVPKLHELLDSLDLDSLALTGFTPDDLEGMLKSVDAMDSIPAEDGGSQQIGAKWQIIVECTNELEQVELLEKFDAEGLTCRALVS